MADTDIRRGSKKSVLEARLQQLQQTPDFDTLYLGKTAKAADSDKLDGVHLADIRLGQNLLHNWDFRNPADQRGRAGQSRVFSWDFAYDRWTTYSAATLTLVPNSHVVISSGGVFGQGIEGLWLMGKTVTVSILGIDGIIRFGTGTFSGIIGGTSSFQISGFGGINLVNATDHTRLYLIPDAERSVVAVKMELGTVSTLHLDPPVDHAVELPKCQRYYEELGTGMYFVAYATTAVIVSSPFAVYKRITPSFSLLIDTMALTDAVSNYTATTLTMYGSGGDKKGMRQAVLSGFTGLTPGKIYYCANYYDGIIGASSDL